MSAWYLSAGGDRCRVLSPEQADTAPPAHPEGQHATSRGTSKARSLAGQKPIVSLTGAALGVFRMFAPSLATGGPARKATTPPLPGLLVLASIRAAGCRGLAGEPGLTLAQSAATVLGTTAEAGGAAGDALPHSRVATGARRGAESRAGATGATTGAASATGGSSRDRARPVRARTVTAVAGRVRSNAGPADAAAAVVASVGAAAALVRLAASGRAPSARDAA